MRAWQIERFGLENLTLVERQEQKLKANEIRISIKACSLNYRDLMVVKGIYNPKTPLPLIPLSDGAGVVTEIGPEVQSFEVGDRVCAVFSERWTKGLATAETMNYTLGSPVDGMLSESRVFLEDGLIKIPDYLTYAEASTLPCAGVTAFNAIMYQSELKPNDTVLLIGTGGVSIFALQFAKTNQINSILLSGSDEKIYKAMGLGALHCINYKKNPSWESAVLDYTRGCGADAVVEVGGIKTLGKAIQSVKPGGVICVIGVLSGAQDGIDLRPILMNNIRLQGIFVGAKTVFEAMNRVLEHSQIHPVIDRIFPFEEANQAFDYFASQQHFGKVCITLE